MKLSNAQKRAIMAIGGLHGDRSDEEVWERVSEIYTRTLEALKRKGLILTYPDRLGLTPNGQYAYFVVKEAERVGKVVGEALKP